MTPSGRQNRPTLLRIIALARGRIPAYAIALALSAAVTAASQYTGGAITRTVFDAIAVLDGRALLQGILVYGSYHALLIVARLIAGLGYQSVTVAITGDLRKAVFHRLQRLPIAYYDHVHSGDLLSRLTSDITVLEPAYTTLPSGVVGQLAAGLGAVGFVGAIDWRLTAFAILMSVLYAVPSLVTMKPLRRVAREVQERQGILTSGVTEVLAGALVVRAYGTAEVEIDAFKKESGMALRSSLLQARLQSIVTVLGSAPVWLGQVGLIGIGGYLAMAGVISIGEAVAAFSLYSSFLRLFLPLQSISRFQDALAGGDRLLEIMDAEAEPARHPAADPSPTHDPGPSSDPACGGSHPPKGRSMAGTSAIWFDGVVLDYNSEGSDSLDPSRSSARRALEGVSFDIVQGERVALVGPSGSGKTSVLNLILGLYVPDAGQVRVAGISHSERDLAETRRLLSYVPQDSHLFAGSVEDNIRYGRPEASREEVIAAARAANAHDFISAFPDGYDTAVGERGAQLSGGQRQRIAIARAIMRDAPILLLDEATSSLDSESERLVQEALARLMLGRTSLVVAHRLGTVLDADRILVMDEGKVVQEGTHLELMADPKGLYRRLYDMQFG